MRKICHIPSHIERSCEICMALNLQQRSFSPLFLKIANRSNRRVPMLKTCLGSSVVAISIIYIDAVCETFPCPLNPREHDVYVISLHDLTTFLLDSPHRWRNG